MKYNLVSGFDRGGTSCLMGALRECGIPVIGFRYPIQYPVELLDKKAGVEESILKDGGLLDPLDYMKKSNPTGFWEVPSICLKQGLQEEHARFGNNGNLVKVPLNIITVSEPKMIGKAVVILRNPLKVIQSQIRVHEPDPEEGFIKMISLSLINHLKISLEWLKRNKIPSIQIRYEKLVENPRLTLKKACDFLDRGDPDWGAKIIKPRLDRSEPIKVKYKETEELMKLWNKKDFSYNHEIAKDREQRTRAIRKKYNIEVITKKHEQR